MVEVLRDRLGQNDPDLVRVSKRLATIDAATVVPQAYPGDEEAQRRALGDLERAGKIALRSCRDASYPKPANDTARTVSELDVAAQPSVNSALRTASKVEMPLPGFSGATPAEICQRYAAGFIDRAQLVDELVRFPYAKSGETDG